jgi:hypothetical protein
MSFLIGVARCRLSPWWGVELAGWGYYLGRTWQRVRDHTAATALVIDDGTSAIAVVACDLMYLDAAFTKAVRDEIARHTGIRPEAVCVAASHSHNTPTVALIRGAGEVDEAYRAWAARQAATAAILAWKQRRPAVLRVGREEAAGWSFNRTRDKGPVDTRLGVWRADDLDGRPLAVVVNFQAHPVIMMALGAADLARDWPGDVTDLIETAVPGAAALFLMGACGDVNVPPQWAAPSLCREPGRAIGGAALRAFASARPVEGDTVAATIRAAVLPTRRWDRAAVLRDREEADYRLRTGDTTGWLDGVARVVVNYPARLPERYGGDVGKAVGAVCRFVKEWSDDALCDLDSRPEELACEVQALRAGDAFLAANPSELFTSLALDLRRRWRGDDLTIVGYANDSLGYLPDAHDVERRTYAAWQSPRFKGQFPFTAAAGDAFVQASLDALSEAAARKAR